MRQWTVLCLVLATACLEEGSPDGIDEVGRDGGKADGSQLSECETREILAYLNEGITAEGLTAAGVHERAAKALVEYRDGADKQFGTDDDDKFDTIDEVDEVAYVGRTAFSQLATATVARCIYEDARDVTKLVVAFPAGTAAPTTYQYPGAVGFNLGGTEFWQKWDGGRNPTYDFAEGTDAGRLCMQASAIRFEAIMKNPPAEIARLRDETNWNGGFFNWNDDYSKSTWGDATAPRLWAWRTHLIKWISQTKQDGSCLLPTRDLVVKVAEACLPRGPDIQGCSAQ